MLDWPRKSKPNPRLPGTPTSSARPFVDLLVVRRASSLATKGEGWRARALEPRPHLPSVTPSKRPAAFARPNPRRSGRARNDSGAARWSAKGRAPADLPTRDLASRSPRPPASARSGGGRTRNEALSLDKKRLGGSVGYVRACARRARRSSRKHSPRNPGAGARRQELCRDGGCLVKLRTSVSALSMP